LMAASLPPETSRSNHKWQDAVKGREILPRGAAGQRLLHDMIEALDDVFPGAERDFGIRPGKIEDEERKLASFLAVGAERSHLRLWDNDRRLVISRRLSRLSGAAKAAAAMSRAGWPVSVRPSGGTAVAHGPGILNISLFIISREYLPLNAGYDRLCELIVEAARLNGIALSVGLHATSYCAGAHDIGWNGRKLAGTAGLARRRADLHGAIFHACLSVCDDWRAGLEAICKFEQAVGMPASYANANHISLSEVAAHSASHRRRASQSGSELDLSFSSA
jgi:lipoate-protein ligase A